MHRLATIVCLSLLWAGMAAAGPVDSDDAEKPSGGMNQLPDPPPAGIAALPTGTPLPSSAARPATAGSAESTPAPSVQAAEIIREAEAGAAAADPPAPAARQSTQSGPAATAARAPEAENSLREFGKAAVHWLKDSVPWLRGNEQDEDAQKPTVMDSAEWSASALEGDKSARSANMGDVRLHGPAGAPPVAAAGLGSANPLPWLDPQRNIVLEAIELVRVVVGHPMTWLVVALFAIGGYAVSKLDRRPK